jgi:general L-amino acid transport system substrate-binding protein
MAQAPTPQPPGPTLSAVQARGEVLCGVHQDLPGFGFLDPNTGDVRGFDVDFCRALAAAIFGDVRAVQLQLVGQTDGLAALAAGDLDVLAGSLTWTLTGETGGLTFAPPLFYNGQSFIVRGDSSLTDWAQLDGATICLSEGSRAAVTLPRVMSARGLGFQAVTLPTAAEAGQAFLEGRCQGYSADRVALALLRRSAPDPTAFVIWDSVYTSEPLAPVTRGGDLQWAAVVRWTALGLIYAEQAGITSENLNGFRRQSDETETAYIARVGLDVARFVDGNLGIGGVLGLPNDFMAAVIREVGSYGELYNRHLGPNGTVPLARAANSLARDGGLLVVPDWR